MCRIKNKWQVCNNPFYVRAWFLLQNERGLDITWKKKKQSREGWLETDPFLDSPGRPWPLPNFFCLVPLPDRTKPYLCQSVSFCNRGPCEPPKIRDPILPHRMGLLGNVNSGCAGVCDPAIFRNFWTGALQIHNGDSVNSWWVYLRKGGAQIFIVIALNGWNFKRHRPA